MMADAAEPAQWPALQHFPQLTPHLQQCSSAGNTTTSLTAHRVEWSRYPLPHPSLWLDLNIPISVRLRVVSDHLSSSSATGPPWWSRRSAEVSAAAEQPLSGRGQNPVSLLGVWPAAAAVMKTFELFIQHSVWLIRSCSSHGQPTDG